MQQPWWFSPPSDGGWPAGRTVQCGASSPSQDPSPGRQLHHLHDDHENDDNIENLSDLDTPVTIGAEFFPIASIPSMSPCTSSTTSSITSIVQTASQLTCLTASGEFELFESTMIKCILIKNAFQ